MITITDGNGELLYKGDMEEFLELNDYDSELEEIFSANQNLDTFSFTYNCENLMVEKEIDLFY